MSGSTSPRIQREDQISCYAACRPELWGSGAEKWVHSAVIEQLLAMGFQSSEIHYEFALGPGSRPDVVVICPEGVLVVECKRRSRYAGATAVKQTRHYAEAAHRRWPDRETEAWLVWGHDEDPAELSVLVVTS